MDISHTLLHQLLEQMQEISSIWVTYEKLQKLLSLPIISLKAHLLILNDLGYIEIDNTATTKVSVCRLTAQGLDYIQQVNTEQLIKQQLEEFKNRIAMIIKKKYRTNISSPFIELEPTIKSILK